MGANPLVDDWFEIYEHPAKNAMLAVRDVSLMFHTGASIPGVHARLEGGGDTARYMKFADLADVEGARTEIEAVVAAWCDSR